MKIPRHLKAPVLVFACASSLIAGCAAGGIADPGPGSAPSPSPSVGSSDAPGIRVTPAQASAIGRKVWQNECSGTVEGLTSWNKGEQFASLGIGHFIWYPAGQEGPFEESFPALVAFLGARNVAMPAWLESTKDCPWPTRDAFMRDSDSPRMRELRQFLAGSVGAQAEFIALRLERALPKMLASAAPEDRDRIRRRFYAVGATPNGLYALMDYVNFKGEGTNPNERYRGEGWGLLQVLSGMQGTPSGQAAAAEFSASAKRTLTRRVANSPTERGEQRWLKGWLSRCDSYARPLAGL